MSDKLTKEEVYEKISELTDEAYDLINQAQTLAEEYKVSFGFNLSYGMGGTFDKDWDASDEEEEAEWRWHSSSESC